MADQTNAEVSDERLREIGGWAKLVSTFPQAEGHPPPERYADIAAVCTELLTRRSVTSQASEGEVVDAGPISEHESTDEAMWRAAVLKDRGYYFLAASERLEQEAYDRAAARGEHTGTDGI